MMLPSPPNDQKNDAFETQTEFPRSIGRVAKRSLSLHGYTRYDQLTTTTLRELLKIHGVGKKAIRILEEELGIRNMSFESDRKAR